MPHFAYFLMALAALALGYLIYGRFTERLFGPDPGRATPAVALPDGVDYVRLPTWKVFLIQLLNIAGVGPVFGPILGALYGPSALVWIVAGAIFAGGVHDYFSAMMSLRRDGRSLPDVVGRTLGRGLGRFAVVFSLILLVLVGAVFVTAPAGILASLTGDRPGPAFWMAAIFAYYFLATILPIDLVIARLYPLFALVLLVMVLGVAGALLLKGYAFYSWAPAPGASVFANVHPEGLPLWPMMFITIACGALSGFHATQSPLMSRCLGSERDGRKVFYGAMVAEGAIALVWATAGLSFYDSPAALHAAISQPGGAANVVREVAVTLLGPVGGALAILGVVVLPISSGDTAFRAARLLLADLAGVAQKRVGPRLALALPLFAAGLALCRIDFSVIWRYFGWSNQLLATLVLWSAAAYAVRRGACHWPVTIPALFMTATCAAYICVAPEGFGLGWPAASKLGWAAAAAAQVLFGLSLGRLRSGIGLESPRRGPAAGPGA
jgi:carbon starvation protein CstA